MTDDKIVATCKSADGTTDGANALFYMEGDTAKPYPKGTVLFPTVAPDTYYYMKETAVPMNESVPLYRENKNKYIVLVGKTNLNKTSTGLWATNEVLGGITTENVTAQRGTVTVTDGKYERDYAIFRIDSATGKAVTTPDIAKYGIVNLPVADRKVMLRKVEKKSDNTWIPLQGAQFRLLDYDLTPHDFGKKADGTDAESDYMRASDSEGVFFIGRLPLGVYYLEETEAPESYQEPNDGTYYKLTVSATGDITMSDTAVEPDQTAPAESTTPSGGGNP